MFRMWLSVDVNYDTYSSWGEVTGFHSNVMSQHQWSVSYESCHRLPIRWIITTQNTILHFITKIRDLMGTMTTNWTRKSYTIFYHCYRYLTITQCSKPLLPWWLRFPSQPWSSHCQVSQSPLVIFKSAKTLLLYSCFLSFSPFLTSLVSGSVLSDLGFVHFFSL